MTETTRSPSEATSREASLTRIPRHIAVIMDGNGRWARRQGLPRIVGHRKGADTLDAVTEECARLGVGRLTVYAFSSENWKRPRTEVAFLMKLLRGYLVRKLSKVMKNNIRLTAIGRTEELPGPVGRELRKAMAESAENRGMTLCLALNYGGRTEIVDACRRFLDEVLAGRRRPEELDEAALQSYMYDPRMPAPDLVIRTGGDMRLSNFLLWHIAYSELVVTPTLWPAYTVEELHEAIREFAARERRFGGIRADGGEA